MRGHCSQPHCYRTVSSNTGCNRWCNHGHAQCHGQMTHNAVKCISSARIRMYLSNPGANKICRKRAQGGGHVEDRIGGHVIYNVRGEASHSNRRPHVPKISPYRNATRSQGQCTRQAEACSLKALGPPKHLALQKRNAETIAATFKGSLGKTNTVNRDRDSKNNSLMSCNR